MEKCIKLGTLSDALLPILIHQGLREAMGYAEVLVSRAVGGVFGGFGGFHEFNRYEYIEDLSVIFPCHCTR